MKKIKRLAFVGAVVVSFCLTSANAQARWYSIAELKTAADTYWKQTYSAYGRTIEIDVELEIPHADKAPVLQIKRLPPVDEPEYSMWKQYFSKPNENSQGAYAFVTVMDQGTTGFAFNIFDSSKYIETATRTNSSDPRADWQTTHAENNPLSMWDGFEFAQKKLREVCGDGISLYPLHGGIKGRIVDRATGTPLRDKGEYTFQLCQELRGIPIITPISDTYVNFADDSAIGNRYIIFNTLANLYDEKSYEITATLCEEVGVVHDDIPLQPFEQGKKEIETLINRGNIRDIYSIRLAYVIFHNQNDLNNSYFLVPSWVVSCEWYKEADMEKYEGGMNEMYWDGSEYHNIILNAQTGTLYDPFSVEADRYLSPAITGWPTNPGNPD